MQIAEVEMEGGGEDNYRKEWGNPDPTGEFFFFSFLLAANYLAHHRQVSVQVKWFILIPSCASQGGEAHDKLFFFAHPRGVVTVAIGQI